MIEIYNNVLPTALSDKLEKIVTSNDFGWFLIRDVHKHNLSKNVLINNNTVNTIQLNHDVYDINSGINSNVFNLCDLSVNIICQNLNFDTIITRLKFNMLFNNKDIIKNKHNTPHVDDVNNTINQDVYTLIYYVSDSDGDTVIFNEQLNSKPIKKLSVYKKITPKKNKAIIFKGSYFHASTNPLKFENRIVMNVNLIKKESR